MPRVNGTTGNPIGSPLLENDGAAGAPTDQVAAVQQRVDQVRSVMTENVNAMVANIENASNLEAASSDLAAQAQQFQRVSRQARRHFWWQNFRMKLCIGLVMLAFILMICVWAGAFYGPDPASLASPPPPRPPPRII